MKKTILIAGILISAIASAPGSSYGFGARDAFEGLDECKVADVPIIQEPSIGDAMDILRPCMVDVSERYGVLVRVDFYANSYQGEPTEAAMLILVVSGKVPVGNSVLLDLQKAVANRGSRLLTIPTLVWLRAN